MESYPVRRGDLVLLHEEPETLNAWVSHDDRAEVVVVAGGASRDVDAGPLVSSWGTGIAEVIRLVVDGPRPALEVAAAGLARRHSSAVVAVAAVGGVPTPWWMLDVVVDCGILVGVDLRSVQWRSADALWWTGRSGPQWLPLRVHDQVQAIEAAQVLSQLADPGGGSPTGDWIRALAAGGVLSDPASWDRVLCAQYVAMTWRHVRDRKTGSAVDHPEGRAG